MAPPPRGRHIPVPALSEEAVRRALSSAGVQLAPSPPAPTDESTLAASSSSPHDGAFRIARTPSAGLRPLDPRIRGPAFRPDRLVDLVRVGTGSDVFDPSIAPFERMMALDRVQLDADGETPILLLGPGPLREVPLPRPPPRPTEGDEGWAVFRAEVDFDFSSERRLPIPTPAPGSRLIEAHVTPNARVRFLRDQADNLYLEPIDYRGPLRLRFRVAAPLSYFGTPLPERSPAALRLEPPPMPAPLRSRALGAAARLGLFPGATVAHILRTLAAHFRSFDEAGEPPEGPDLLMAFVEGGRGVCRHRAYAFVVLAQALGLDARFVHNEVHAWAEVDLGGGHWLRVDLGGALLRRPPSSDRSARPAVPGPPRPLFEPPERDPLPQPLAYRRALAALRQGDAAPPPGPSSDPLAAAPSARGDTAPVPLAGPSSRRRPVRIVVLEAPRRLVRGQPAEVFGEAHEPDGTPASGLRIEVWIRTAHGTRHVLGSAISSESGRFRIRFLVPTDLPTGPRALALSSPGDDRFLPAPAPRLALHE